MNIACIVTGDRHAIAEQWEPVILAAFWTLKPDRNNVILIHGAQRKWDPERGEYVGIDHVASQLFRRTWPPHVIEPYPADWVGLGRSAGPRRNQTMLERLLHSRSEGVTVGVMAFHDSLSTSKGTGHMVKIAKAAGVPVLAYTSRGDQIHGEKEMSDIEVRQIRLEEFGA